jgi:transcriptional regulator with XRE-family HTH domain
MGHPRKNGAPSVTPYRGKKNPDGFMPSAFREARRDVGFTIRELAQLTNLAPASIGKVEQGVCHNPEIRAVLINALKMTRTRFSPGQIIQITPPVVGKAADTDFAQWLIDNSTDELVIARAKYELLLAQRRAGA